MWNSCFLLFEYSTAHYWGAYTWMSSHLRLKPHFPSKNSRATRRESQSCKTKNEAQSVPQTTWHFLPRWRLFLSYFSLSLRLSLLGELVRRQSHAYSDGVQMPIATPAHKTIIIILLMNAIDNIYGLVILKAMSSQPLCMTALLIALTILALHRPTLELTYRPVLGPMQIVNAKKVRHSESTPLYEKVIVTHHVQHCAMTATAVVNFTAWSW